MTKYEDYPGFTYDAACNQTRVVRTDGSAQRFQYDAANRLIQVRDDFGYTLEAFTYGDSNERLISEEAGLRTYYACGGSAEYIESTSSSIPAWSKSYVYLGGRLLATLTPNGSSGEAVQYHHPDRLGTRLVTDPSNGTSFEQVALPFGTALNAESTGATNRRFTSYDRSTTTGLDYANNRHYDSQQGRFTQVDPAGMRMSYRANPQTFNLYAYCGNDPINRMDPSGLGFLSGLFKAIGKAIKIIAIILVVVVVVAIVVALASQPETGGIAFAKFLLFKLAPVLATILAGATGFQMGGFTTGAGGTPPWNPSSRSVFGSGFQDQGRIYTCPNPPNCQGNIPQLPPEVVNVPASTSIWSRIWGGIKSGAGSVVGGITATIALTHTGYRQYSIWMEAQTHRALRRMGENSQVQVGVNIRDGSPIYGTINLPIAGGLEEDLLLPSTARTFTNAEAAFSHLEDFHGIDPILASERLHGIKAAWGLGPAENVLFDRTGGVWDAATGRYLGSLTQGGAKRIK